MAQWWVVVDGHEVRVSTDGGEPGTHSLTWTAGAAGHDLTVAHADRSPLSDAELADLVRPFLPGASGVVSTVPPQTAAVVRQWWPDRGWGVVDSPQTPGGCWVHFSAVRVDGYVELRAGQDVVLQWEAGEQDRYGYRAVAVWPAGREPVAPEEGTGDSGAYSSALHLVIDAPDSAPET